jgi:hypothetical protein
MIESPPTYRTNPETIALMEAYWQDGTLRKFKTIICIGIKLNIVTDIIVLRHYGHGKIA